MTDYCERHGEKPARRYDAIDAGQINACWAHLITVSTPGLARDIGAGSGRDARWLARRGRVVVACRLPDDGTSWGYGRGVRSNTAPAKAGKIQPAAS